VEWASGFAGDGIGVEGPGPRLRPSVRVRADVKGNKSKRADELPLHPDLAEAMRQAKPPFAKPTDRVFKTTPILRTLKRDLDRAAIPFADENGRTVDRHAFKTTFVSWLAANGVSETAMSRLAQHSPKGVTERHYQDFGVFDLWAEIQKLPSMIPAADSDVLRATRTDSEPVTNPRGC